MTSTPSSLTFPRIHLHEGDLPADHGMTGDLAVDTETTGLHPVFTRLCLVQLRARDGDIHLVRIGAKQTKAPILKKLLEDRKTIKIFHYARADIGFLQQHLGINCQPLFCTKMASKLARTNIERHGLKDTLRDLFSIDVSKYQQQTDWSVTTLTEEQKHYAASDVLHLHALKDKMVELLTREERMDIAQKCFDFLPVRAQLDRSGWYDMDIFAHGKGHYARD